VRNKKAASERRCLEGSDRPIAAIYLSIKPPERRTNYFAGGVSAGFSAGILSVAGGGVVAGFVGAGFFSAQPATAIAATISVNANSFFIALVS
jgi:hypothetical protein